MRKFSYLRKFDSKSQKRETKRKSSRQKIQEETGKFATTYLYKKYSVKLNAM